MNVDKNIAVVAEISTPLHPCNIETITNSASNTQFICGMYELSDEASQSRSGSIVLYDLQHDANYQSPSISMKQCIDTDGGVFDLKICDNISNNSKYIASSLSSGSIVVYQYSCDVVTIDTQPLASASSPEDTSLYLSVDWSSKACSCSDESLSLCTSTQNSSIMVHRFTTCELFEDIIIKDAHVRYGESMPIWTTCFNSHDNAMLLSGGDDCAMKLWDIRAFGCSQAPVAMNNKSHDAGVTVGLWHPIDPHILFTGSYDEHIRIWDDRKISQPLHSIKTAGGVWRLKYQHPSPSPSSSSYLFSANMQGGSSIIHFDESYHLISEACYHNSILENYLAYGMDVISETELEVSTSTSNFTVASSSFYNNLIHIWSCSC